MSTKIIGNQIDAATRAIVTALTVTEQLNLPELNQAAVNALGTPAYGTLVYNSTEDEAQIWKQDVSGSPGWDSVGGGGPSVGENSIIRTNGTTISENLTVGPTANGGVEFTNGFTAAPITIANGYTVTIENGATWTIIGPDENIEAYRYFNNVGVNEHLRMVPGSTLEFGQTKENFIAFAKSGTVTVDHSLATIFITTNPSGYNGNFTINFNNVPNVGGFVYTAQVIIRQQNGTGTVSNVLINGQSTSKYYAASPSSGSGWDIINYFFYVDGENWNVFGNNVQYSV
ncbi:hypothetical protein CPXG_00190 [Cyanophage P-RSM6]|uniref:hypothetical protein n=1 Tax=Cyanophage P-RSM6 TaxID=929832 RepID=UPI0002C17F2F|nr:hypothetical protein CPXG_00190 [Cyanophage P-RSM6]AGH56993.1 hypothetical protein CPXG_00190 [Cyanophage P-RSM6]|tara:strand:+ start:2555 stop:3412 length:858 start_codon:yes stop_codon:yes gene_type:complete